MSKAKQADCESCHEQKHPDHKAELSRLRRISGQVSGVEKMILEGRYCPDILMQTRAISAAIRSLEASLLKRHINHCVSNALHADDVNDREAKIAELVDIFAKRLER